MTSKLKTLKQAIRAGYAWPGGYRFTVYMEDGESMCLDCARKEFKQIARDTYAGKPYHTGWGFMAVDIHFEGPANYCCNCNCEMPSEYGDPEEDS